jgi:cytochrome P450
MLLGSPAGVTLFPGLTERDLSAGTETIPLYGARMTTSSLDFPSLDVTAPAEVRAVLADPAFVVPPLPDHGSPGGIGWLRTTVSRFSAGDVHRRRRSLVVDELAGIDPASLRRMAFDRTVALLEAHGGPVEVMATVARVVPVELLAEALGLPAGISEYVNTVASAYHPPVEASPSLWRVRASADQAVARLVDACGGVADETTAARIGALVQACDATAGLVGNAVAAMLRGELTGSAEVILAETLRRNPSVRATRRQAMVATRIGDTEVVAGTVVTLNLATPDVEDPLTFGAGPRKCPGRDHAVAIAAGIVEAVCGRRLAQRDIEYEPSANLRLPVSLLVR